ncbi:MAG: hypothetical protein GXP25_25570 [Planctomycetes bacterium]|nr:hypothetical protein [Planctomycetota bacterium]
MMRNLGIIAVLVCGVVACRLLSADVEVNGDRIVVTTEKGRIEIDRGVIVKMTNTVTGETYTAEAGDKGVTGLLWWRTPVWVDEKAEVTCTKTGPDAATVAIVFPAGHELTTTVAIDPATQDILIRQRGSAKRKGLYGVQWGIAGLDVDKVRTLVPGNSGVRLDRTCPVQEIYFNWPVGWEVQMMVVEGKGGGFSVWSEDREMRFKALRWRRRKGEVTLGFQSHNHAPFDDLTTAESVEWRLAFHKGDWRVPAKRYRDWMEKAWGLTRLEKQQPAWVKDIRFLVIMGMEKETVDALKERVPPSATLLYIPNWRKDGYDKNYPDYTAREGFQEFVKYAMGLGFHVMPHMNYFGCDPKNPAYERFKQYQLRDPFKKELLWWIPPMDRMNPNREPRIKFAYIHPGSRAWRDELTNRLIEAQRKYGFDAIHLDQTICIPNHAGGKVDGLYAPQGNVLLHKQLREAMPQVALSGEGLDEVTSRYEAFAQRHASRAVNHVFGTWDDGFIACGHPISSYFLTPYTTIYGYLGMSNPSNRGLYLAWKRAYENWGVIPTYARPSATQIEAGSAIVQCLFDEAKVWVDDELRPDFESQWGPRTTFRLKGRNGVRVDYVREASGSSRMVRTTAGKEELIYKFVKGQSSITGPGNIADWYAYDAKKIFGLDPNTTYVYLPEARDPKATHIIKAPDDAMIHVFANDDTKFMASLKGRPPKGSVDFVEQINEAETGILVDGKTTALDYGAGFQASQANVGRVLKRAIFAHPPWKVKAKGPEPARTFGRFTVDLPRDCRARLEFFIGLRLGVNDRSDGVRFLVAVDGETVFNEVWAKSKWKPVSVSLDKWRGKKVSIAFITTPGPANNASFDWACWGEPRVVLEAPPRRIQVQVVTTKQTATVVGPDPELSCTLAAKRDGMCRYDVNMAMPGQAIFLWKKPKPAALPLDLAAEPFALSVVVQGAPAQLPIRHVGAGPGNGKSNGVEKSGINAHPPNNGWTSVDYLLRLPDKKPITLSFAVGLRDGSRSESVIFVVQANGKELYRRQVTAPDGWHPAEVDLSEYAGKAVLLSLIVDADGPYSYDWATWAEPTLR